MINAIKNFINKKKKEKYTQKTADHMINCVKSFVFDENLEPKLSLVEKNGKMHDVYTLRLNDGDSENISMDRKVEASEYALRLLYHQHPMAVGMIFYHTKTNPNYDIGVHLLEPGDEPDSVLVDFQSEDGASYVVIPYKRFENGIEIGDSVMYQAQNKLFYKAGDLYARHIDDIVVFFKILHTEVDGVHILCYSNKIKDDDDSYKVELTLEPDEDYLNLLKSLGVTTEGFHELNFYDLDNTPYVKCHIPGSHVPVSWEYFLTWEIAIQGYQEIEDSELEGYKIRKEDEGDFFNL